MDTIEFLRQFRISNYAIFDITLSFLGIYLIAPLLSKIFAKAKLEIPKRNWLYLTLPIGILIHILVGNITPMTENFINLEGHYFLKIFIIILFILGIKNIRIIK